MAIDADLFRAILAMDAYNRGYRPGVVIGSAAASLGRANILFDSSILPVGFAATAYDLSGVGRFASGEKVVSYRCPDDLATDGPNGFGVAVGSPYGPQARIAIEFYNVVAGANPRAANVGVRGHPLGGGCFGAGILAL